MRSSRVTLTLAALFAITMVVWRFWTLPGQLPAPLNAVGPDQAAIERVMERTVSESRTGVVEPPMEAPAVVDAAKQADASQRAVIEPSVASGESGAGVDALPAGYTLGAYRGAMQRTVLTSPPEPRTLPQPGLDGRWFGTGSGSRSGDPIGTRIHVCRVACASRYRPAGSRSFACGARLADRGQHGAVPCASACRPNARVSKSSPGSTACSAWGPYRPYSRPTRHSCRRCWRGPRASPYRSTSR